MFTITSIIILLSHLKKKVKKSAYIVVPIICLLALIFVCYALTVKMRITANPPTNVYGLTFENNNAQPVSAVGKASLRFNGTAVQQSISGGAYGALGADTLQSAYTNGGASGGTVTTTASGGPLKIISGDDATANLNLKLNSANQTAPWVDLRDTNDVSLLTIEPALDGVESPVLHFKSQVNAGYSYLIAESANGAFRCIQQLSSGNFSIFCNGNNYAFFDGNGNVTYLAINANGIQTQRVSQVLPNTLAFSATPAFDCTAGDLDLHFGPVTGNITGPTMVSGLDGEHCTIVLLKDASGTAYTITGSWGANVHVNAETFATTANSKVVYKFVFDGNLSTPGWVQEGFQQAP